ncbi:hypothetical protein AgCh_020917 [Apium graveolens]
MGEDAEWKKSKLVLPGIIPTIQAEDGVQGIKLVKTNSLQQEKKKKKEFSPEGRRARTRKTETQRAHADQARGRAESGFLNPDSYGLLIGGLLLRMDCYIYLNKGRFS